MHIYLFVVARKRACINHMHKWNTYTYVVLTPSVKNIIYKRKQFI